VAGPALLGDARPRKGTAIWEASSAAESLPMTQQLSSVTPAHRQPGSGPCSRWDCRAERVRASATW